MAYLILVRHGKSEWNHLGLWTGHTDVELVQEGIEEACRAGKAICDINIDCAHVSELKRAHQTLHEIKKAIGKEDLSHKSHKALNERHYGIHTGKNKWQVKEEVGEEAFQAIRRGWDVPIKEGETLKDVYTRAIPYYNEHIKPELKEGRNVLVVAHGNTIRALVKYLENISDKDVEGVEIGTGEVHCYKMDDDGLTISKEIRSTNDQKAKV